MTHLAGWWGFAETFRRLRYYSVIAAANTFVKREHIMGYIHESRKCGIRVFIHEANTPWANDPAECFKRNQHGVPLDVIQRMKDTKEFVTQAEIDDILGLIQRN